MKKIITLFIILFVSRSLIFGAAHEKIQTDYIAGRISATELLIYEALLTYVPEKLPEMYQDDIQPVKCGFGLQARLRQAWPELSFDQQILLKSYVSSPLLEYSAVSPRGLFRMHYTDNGLDAVPSEDLNNNDIPDFIEEAGLALDQAYAVIVEYLGFHAPPVDVTDGPEWDAYFRNGNYYGETGFRETISHNPWIQTSYMNMDNDFTHTYTYGLDGLRVTCAHEFFHMVQVGYQFRDQDIFLMEASATWMEDVVYDQINDYVQYLNRFLSYDNVFFYQQDGWHEYGLSLWFHFLSARYGQSIIRLIWDEITVYSALDAGDKALQVLGSNLSDEMGLFYGWNLMTGSRADTLRFYPEGHLYPEQQVSEYYTLSDDNSLRKNVKKTAAKYIETDLSNGSVLIWALVNTDWTSSMNQADGMLKIRMDDAEPYYQMITDSIFSLLISEETQGWQYSVMVQKPGEMITVNTYTEFNASLFSTLTGTVWIYNRDGSELQKQGGLAGVMITCRSAGPDSLLCTEDDLYYSPQITDDQGKYVFFGLSSGKYLIALDISTIPDPFITFDGITFYEIAVKSVQPIEDVDFAFHQIESDDLPASIPNPFIPDDWPEVKIPFNLGASDLAEIFIFSSQGFKVYHDQKYFEVPEAACFRWDGRVNGSPVPGGVYVYVIMSHDRLMRREKIAVIR